MPIYSVPTNSNANKQAAREISPYNGPHYPYEGFNTTRRMIEIKSTAFYLYRMTMHFIIRKLKHLTSGIDNRLDSFINRK